MVVKSRAGSYRSRATIECYKRKGATANLAAPIDLASLFAVPLAKPAGRFLNPASHYGNNVPAGARTSVT
jgi:hypothetical protein